MLLNCIPKLGFGLDTKLSYVIGRSEGRQRTCSPFLGTLGNLGRKSELQTCSQVVKVVNEARLSNLSFQLIVSRGIVLGLDFAVPGLLNLHVVTDRGKCILKTL